MTPEATTNRIKAIARSAGFDLVGVARAGPLDRAAYYRDWLAKGYAGEMTYLRRNVHIRADPRELLPGARSVIVGGVIYGREDCYRPQSAGSSRPPVPSGIIAQYARGEDYHVVLRDMFEQILRTARGELDVEFDARVCVDTAPVLERELAVAAGLGWFGKNTCLLNSAVGSYVLLGELVTTLELVPDEPVIERCAQCTRCIDACPTGALIGPRELDTRRCIAYLTIEHRGSIEPTKYASIGERLFGCDICQQVCPYNARAPKVRNARLRADRCGAHVPLESLVTLRSSAHRRLTKGTALRRAKAAMWRRNAVIVLGNVTTSRADLARLVSVVGEEDDPAVSTALSRLRQKSSR